MVEGKRARGEELEDRRMKRLLRGKYPRALVTGASGGLGRAFVAMLAQEGVDVWGTSRAPERLGELLPGRGLALDLGREASVRHFLEETLPKLDPLDLLVNNAGEGIFGPYEAFAREQIEAQVRVGLLGPMVLARACWDRMQARGRGMVVNVSSLAGEFPMPGFAPYNAAKAGLSGFSRSLMLEAGDSGLGVVDLQLGDFATEFNAHAERLPGGGGSFDAEAAWERIEAHLRGGPDVRVAAEALRRALRKGRSGTVRTGSFWQARVGPRLARVAGERLTRGYLRRYFGLR